MRTDDAADRLDTAEWAYAGRRYKMYSFPEEIQRDLKVLNRPDNWHVFLAWAADVIWIAGMVLGCVLVSPWLYPLAVVIIGARQRGIAGILHDCAHGIGISDRRLQMMAGTVMSAYPIFQLHYAYKVSHVYTHHPKLGNPEEDPDLRFFIEQGVYRKSTRRDYVRRVVLMPLTGRQTYAYLHYLVRNRSRVLSGKATPVPGASTVRRGKRRLDACGFFAFWAVVIALAWSGGWLLGLVLFWIVPYLTTFQIISWYIELSEHTPMIRDSNIDLYMSRNRKGPWWEKLLTGVHGDSYHLEHHLDPRTPFYLRPKAREVRMRDAGYAAVDRQFGGLFTKGAEGQPSAISVIIDYMVESRTIAEGGTSAEPKPPSRVNPSDASPRAKGAK
ncbi:fatty acid desaturase family protein [Streptomyces sp. NPDC001530]|uniref:fatty acid desaturase family protein n=1 Tax=Streptomyces sp. NPDC001530 TaxID=3364582 RepID=UPI0036CF837E